MIAIVGLTQTRTFRTYIRTLVIAQLETLVNGDIEMGSISMSNKAYRPWEAKQIDFEKVRAIPVNSIPRCQQK